MIADQGANDASITTSKARNVAVQSEVFAVLMVSTVADAVANIVKKSTGFQLHARLRRKMVHRL